MAELDAIFPQRAPVLDVSDADRQSLSGLAGAATAIGDSINRGRVDDVEGALKEDIQEVYDSAVQTRENLGVEYIPPEGMDSGEASLRAELARLNAAQQQGSSGARAKAQLEMQRTLESAVAKYPNLREDLYKEYGYLLAVDPRLSELGMFEAEDTQIAANAAKDLQRIKDLAYGDVKDGGFGMNPALAPVGSERFVKEYLRASQHRALQSEATMLLDTMTAQSQIDVVQVSQTLDRAIGSTADLANAAFGGSIEANSQISQAIDRAITGEATATDLAAIQRWSANEVPNLKGKLNGFKAQLGSIVIAIPYDQWDTKFGQNIRSKVEATQQYIDRYISALDNALERPDLLRMVEIENAMRTMDFRVREPDMFQLAFEARALEPLITNLDTLGLTDTFATSEFGEVNVRFFRNYVLRNWKLSNPTVTANPKNIEDIRQDLRQNRVYTEDPYMNGATTPEERSRAALAHLDIFSQMADDQFGVLVESNTKNPPVDKIAEMYAGAASAFGELADNKEGYRPDDLPKAQEILTRDSFITSAIKFRELSSPLGTYLEVLGEEAYEWDYKQPGGPVAGLQRLATDINKPFANTPFINLVTPDFSGIENGTVRFKVDQAKVRQAVTSARPGRLPPGMGGVGPTSSDYQRVLQEIERWATHMSNTFTRELRFKAHVDFLREPGLKSPKYAMAYETNQFSSVVPFSEGE